MKINICLRAVTRVTALNLVGGKKLSFIHKFIQDRRYYVIDVNSGAVHLVDKLVYDLIDDRELKNFREI